MTQCEMCGADLKREEEIVNGTAEIKLSFRRGGHTSFLSNLKAALNDKRWDKVEESSLPVGTSRGAGISMYSSYPNKRHINLFFFFW